MLVTPVEKETMPPKSGHRHSQIQPIALHLRNENSPIPIYQEITSGDPIKIGEKREGMTIVVVTITHPLQQMQIPSLLLNYNSAAILVKFLREEY